MKILFVVEHFYPYVGGAEELFLNLAISLVKSGFDVEVVTTLHDKILKTEEVYEGVKIYRVKCSNRFLFTILSLSEVFRKARRADIIHTTSYNSAFPAFVAGFILRKKVIITFHEVWGKLWFKLPFTAQWKLTGYYLFEWLILKLPFENYIAVSNSTKNALIKSGIDKNKIIRIYNGLNYDLLNKYPHTSPETFTFCFYGRLGISKGLDILLEGSFLFFKKHPESILKLIIPTYPKNLYRKIIEKIQDLKLSKNVILLHDLPKEKLFSEISISTCVIIPSYSEGFCFVAAESAALNIPVISSGKGSLTEVVSGDYITLENMTASAIDNALVQAIAGTWNNKPRQLFPLSQSVELYIQLYKSFQKN